MVIWVPSLHGDFRHGLVEYFHILIWLVLKSLSLDVMTTCERFGERFEVPDSLKEKWQTKKKKFYP